MQGQSPRGWGLGATAQQGLTIQAGRHDTQGVGPVFHMHQQLLSRLNILDDFVVNLGESKDHA